jgi:hypothetical protein
MDHIDMKQFNTHVIVLPFPRRPASGWLRSCCRCGSRFTLPYRTATQRDGRELICTGCWIEAKQ